MLCCACVALRSVVGALCCTAHPDKSTSLKLRLSPIHPSILKHSPSSIFLCNRLQPSDLQPSLPLVCTDRIFNAYLPCARLSVCCRFSPCMASCCAVLFMLLSFLTTNLGFLAVCVLVSLPPSAAAASLCKPLSSSLYPLHPLSKPHLTRSTQPFHNPLQRTSALSGPLHPRQLKKSLSIHPFIRKQTEDHIALASIQ